MEYPQSFDFSHLKIHDTGPPQDQDDSCPTVDDPEQGLRDLATKLGLSLEDFLQQWAQIATSGDIPLNFLTENLDANTCGFFHESACGFDDGQAPFDVQNSSLDQQIGFNQEFCISPQALYVNPLQHTSMGNHVGHVEVTDPSEHVFAVSSTNV